MTKKSINDKFFNKITSRRLAILVMDLRLEHIEMDIKAIVSHFEKDYVLLSNKVGGVNGRLTSHPQESHHSSL